MGKQRRFRFPQGINGVDRYFYPRRQSSTDSFSTNSPTNYVMDILGNDMTSDTDVLGSYTGVPKDGNEQPIQDADDL